MHFQEDHNQTRIRINACEPGLITVNGKPHKNNLILTENEILTMPIPQSVQDFNIDDVINYCKLRPEVLLLGTGAKQEFPARAIMDAATKNNTALEVMDTAAACRIFTLLASEGRKILAILYTP